MEHAINFRLTYYLSHRLDIITLVILCIAQFLFVSLNFVNILHHCDIEFISYLLDSLVIYMCGILSKWKTNSFNV